jgi:hypothetical protein
MQPDGTVRAQHGVGYWRISFRDVEAALEQ